MDRTFSSFFLSFFFFFFKEGKGGTVVSVLMGGGGGGHCVWLSVYTSYSSVTPRLRDMARRLPGTYLRTLLLRLMNNSAFLARRLPGT